MRPKIIVGISGASGIILGIKLLEVLKEKAETFLVISDDAKKIIEYETEYKIETIEKLATHSFPNKDFFSSIASGSFKIDGMVVCPCSMKTLSGIANGYTDNLLIRAADVCLKERRKLILVTRETPLNLIHIKNMEKVTLAGGVILPPVLSSYSKPKGIGDMINHIIGKILDQFNIEYEEFKRWGNG